ncbi:hypothetical protein AFM18_25080 [Achromobacter spanius]|uniref:Lipoprotein n=2 Tax=Achromobacter spanius TaxID=217203 RepID=A0AAW3HXJ5_9BURK|nr:MULTISPECIES: hypothetical protein [Achromobacter]KNE24434.1 hypothetical protein AFM18_25080 [Achromobacter spanius]
MSGCSMVAPPYQASMDNVTALKKAGDFTAKVGEFKSEPSKENANPISLRGSKLSSPYNNSYSAYLAEALKQELTLAGKYSDQSSVEVSGTLLKNDMSVPMGTGTGIVEARFIVTHAGTVKYDQVKTAKHEWPSSFVAAVALPRAIEEYRNLVSKLITDVFSDPAFLNALK